MFRNLLVKWHIISYYFNKIKTSVYHEIFSSNRNRQEVREKKIQHCASQNKIFINCSRKIQNFTKSTQRVFKLCFFMLACLGIWGHLFPSKTSSFLYKSRSNASQTCLHPRIGDQIDQSSIAAHVHSEVWGWRRRGIMMTAL